MTKSREGGLLVVDLHKRYDSLIEFEGEPFVPTRQNLDQLLDDTRSFADSVRRAESTATGGVHSVALAQFLETLDVLEARIISDQSFPNRFVGSLIGKMNTLVNLDPRCEATRAQLLLGVVTGAPSVLKAVEVLGLQVAQRRRQMLLHALNQLQQFVNKTTPELEGAFADSGTVEKLAKRFRDLGALAADTAARVEAAPVPSKSELIQELDYEQTLSRVYGIDINELLSWYRDEVECRNERFYGLAKEIDPERDPFQILDDEIGPFDSPEPILPLMEEYVALARDKSLEYITLPDGETCEVWDVPENLRDSYPWGGYYPGGNSLRGNVRGAVFLNTHNYRTLTRGWAQLNAIHECYPGHHAHFVKTAAGNMPGSFKVATLTSRAAPLNEAVAHRSETLMEDIFGEPAFPLFVAYRRLHTALRIWVDLQLHHFGEDIEKGVDLYEEYMRLDRDVARAQIYSQELTPGYFTVYYYGLKKLRELERECKWEVKPFTEVIFSSGKVSLPILRRLIGLSQEERQQLTGSFYPEQGLS